MRAWPCARWPRSSAFPPARWTTSRAACPTARCERASGKPLGEAQGKRVDFDTIPEADPATCAMISQGRTMGVFQIESPGMRGLLRTLEARALDDIAVALALIRPGASEYGAKETF